MTLHFGQDENGINICFSDINYDGITSSGEVGFNINSSRTNSGGWESSYIRNTICPQFLELLPVDLQNVIGTVTKYTDNVGNASGQIKSNVTATKDKVFLLNYNEIYGLSTGTYPYPDGSDGGYEINNYEADYTEHYEIYQNNDSRIRYQHCNTDNARAWWTRSLYCNSDIYFLNIGQSGGFNYAAANSSRGFAPAIVIY